MRNPSLPPSLSSPFFSIFRFLDFIFPLLALSLSYLVFLFLILRFPFPSCFSPLSVFFAFPFLLPYFSLPFFYFHFIPHLIFRFSPYSLPLLWRLCVILILPIFISRFCLFLLSSFSPFSSSLFTSLSSSSSISFSCSFPIPFPLFLHLHPLPSPPLSPPFHLPLLPLLHFSLLLLFLLTSTS